VVAAHASVLTERIVGVRNTCTQHLCVTGGWKRGFVFLNLLNGPALRLAVFRLLRDADAEVSLTGRQGWQE
jgi:hypothetical protein